MRKMKPVSPNIWNSEDFHALSSNGKVVWFHLITGSHANQGVPGLFRGTCESLRVETRMTKKAHTAAFNEIIRRGMMVRDESLGVIWLPQAVRWNLPTTHTEIRAWAEGLNHLPYCKVVDSALRKVVMDVYKYKNRGFSEQVLTVWSEVFGDRLGSVSVDGILRDNNVHVYDNAGIYGVTDPLEDRGTGDASVSLGSLENMRVCAPASRVARSSIHTLSLSLSPNLSDGRGARAREAGQSDMSEDVADVLGAWLDDVCANVDPKPQVAQAHADLVAGLLAGGIPKSTLLSALQGAAEDGYVQGTKPGAPKNGRRDLLWLFRSIDQIHMFATAGVEASQRKPKTWLTPADFAAKSEEVAPIAPANQAGFRKLMDILGNPPPLLPVMPAKAAIHDPATGVPVRSGNDVLGPTPSKDDGVLDPGQTPGPSDEVVLQWATELEHLQEEEREVALQVFRDTYKVEFPREKLTGTTVPHDQGQE